MLIKDALKELEEKRKRFLSWKKEERLALKVKEKFSKNGLRILIGLDWITATDGMHIDVHGVKNLDDLKPIFRYLSINRCERISDKPWIYPEGSLVRWKYKNLELNAYFTSEEESACKFKEVGKKEVPIYEIDCPGIQNANRT